jgi:hypothetical protein
VIASNQSFETSLSAIDGAFQHGLVDRYHIGAAFSGSHTRTKTGSHVDVDNWSGAISLSRKSENVLGQTVFGIFGEFGKGDYDTYTSIPRYGELFGEGEAKTFGGGIFIRNLFPTNTSVELSVRGGGIRNEFRLRHDPWTLHPEVHNSNTDSSYIGGHIGVTQGFDLTDTSLLEAYGKYFLTHSPEDTFTTAFGDLITVDPFNSSRLRVGGRFTQTLPAETLKLYVGLAAEQEFDGEVTGKLGPDPFLHTVDTGGASGFGELGLSFTPTESVTLSLGGFGWAGRQKGAGGSAAVDFNF